MHALLRTVSRRIKRLVRPPAFDAASRAAHARGFVDRVRFDLRSIHAGHHQMLYRNVPTAKCPFDYVMYQMIICAVRPELIIEIGTNRGGSALYLADLCEIVGLGEVHTIDIEDVAFEEVKQHKRIKRFTQGFENYDLINAQSFGRILVIDDGDHTFESVERALARFSGIVSRDSYFIVEDGIVDELGWSRQYNGGPNRAIREFIAENDSFIIDRSWCDLFGVNATFNTNGFLRKIK